MNKESDVDRHRDTGKQIIRLTESDRDTDTDTDTDR